MMSCYSSCVSFLFNTYFICSFIFLHRFVHLFILISKCVSLLQCCTSCSTAGSGSVSCSKAQVFPPQTDLRSAVGVSLCLPIFSNHSSVLSVPSVELDRGGRERGVQRKSYHLVFKIRVWNWTLRVTLQKWRKKKYQILPHKAWWCINSFNNILANNLLCDLCNRVGLSSPVLTELVPYTHHVESIFPVNTPVL